MKRILLLIFWFVAFSALAQPFQEIDPRSIWKDGSKTTTAVIPFAEGITIPTNKGAWFGDASLGSSRPHILSDGVSLFVTNQLTAGSIIFSAQDSSAYMRFDGPVNSGMQFDTGGALFTIPDDASFIVQLNDMDNTPVFGIYDGTPSIEAFLPFITQDTFTASGAADFGSSGSGVTVTLHSATAGKELTWQPNAASTEPILVYDLVPGRDKHIEISGTDTTYNSFPRYVTVNVTQQYTGASSIAALFDFDYTDDRDLTSGASEFKRLLDFGFTRGAGFSSTLQTAQVEPLKFTLTDQGTYSRAAGITNTLRGVYFELSNFSPIVQATSGSGSYNIPLIEFAGSILGNGNGFTTNTTSVLDANFSYVQISGVTGFAGHAAYGLRFRPTNLVVSGTASTLYGYSYEPTISGTAPATEWAVYAARAGVGLLSDATSGSMATGRLVMGASSDWERGYESDNEAFENIPTGAAYDWRINNLDQMSLAADALTLGDDKATDFLITFNKGNDATIKWDNADKTFYVRTNGAAEFTYPGYGAGVSITRNSGGSGTAEYALQTWGIPSVASGTIGGYWGGSAENGGNYSLTEMYGGTFYNYLTDTGARTISTIVGNYVGNEYSGTNLTATTVKGLYVNAMEGSGVLTASSNMYGIQVGAPTATGTISNYYGVRVENYTGATNEYGGWLGGTLGLHFRAAGQSIYSSAINTLDVGFTTTYNIRLGANPANGTAGTIKGFWNTNGLTVGSASQIGRVTISSNNTTLISGSTTNSTVTTSARLSNMSGTFSAAAFADGIADFRGITANNVVDGSLLGAQYQVSGYIDGATDGGASELGGLSFEVYEYNKALTTGAAANVYGVSGFVRHGSNGTLPTGRGFQVFVDSVSSSGTLTEWASYHSQYGTVDGTITTFIHFKAADNGSQTGTVTNQYGLYVEEMSEGTNKYGSFFEVDLAAHFREATQKVYSSAASTLDLDTATTGNLRVGGTIEYFWDATEFDLGSNRLDATSAKVEMPTGTSLPASCVQGEYWHDTNSDDCADTGGGDGAVCVCKTTNTWALVANI